MNDESQYESVESDIDNLALWKSVQKTPASQVSSGKLNGIGITSVKPHYQRQKATEMFGPFGIGWGVINESFSRHAIGDTSLLSYTAKLFYTLKGERGEFPINATIKEAYITNGGKGYLKIDDTADKKVATDALTKGLSFLGFSADIFHGMYDDHRYVAERRKEEGIEAEQTAIDEKHEYKSWRGKVIADLMLCNNVFSLEKLYFASLQKVQQGDDAQINAIADAKTKRFEELRNKGN